MLTISRSRRMILAAISATLLSAASSPASVLVDFSSYNDGEIVSQPATGTKWSGVSNQFAVSSTAGTSSGKGLISTASATANSSVAFRPTATEVGGVWGTDNIATYTFDIKLVQSSVTTDLYRMFIGSSPSTTVHAIEMSVKGNGDITLNATSVAGLSGALSDKAYHQVKAVVDYANHTYQFYLDGTLKASNPFDWGATTPAFATYGGYMLNVRTSAPAANQIALDNLGISIPEPTALIVSAPIAILGLARRRRTH